jgi:spore coat protein CotF
MILGIKMPKASNDYYRLFATERITPKGFKVCSWIFEHGMFDPFGVAEQYKSFFYKRIIPLGLKQQKQ